MIRVHEQPRLYNGIVVAGIEPPICDHECRWYGKDPALPLCFTCWRQHTNARRQAVRDELARLLSFGVFIREQWPSGVVVEWWMTPDGMTHTKHTHTITGAERTDAIPNVYPSTRWNAAGLAEHMESRAFGFGFDLHAFCIDCGEQLAAISTDKTAEPDPVCADCLARRNDPERGEPMTPLGC